MYSKYTAQISSNGSHFLMARVLVYLTYKVSKLGYGRTKLMVTCLEYVDFPLVGLSMFACNWLCNSKFLIFLFFSYVLQSAK